MESKFKLPTETVELPSKGLLYPEGSPLATGQIEMKYMTAKEEDILTNQNYIKNGTVIDKLLKSLIVTEGVSYDDILIGDKNAIMFAARVLSYGKDYTFKVLGEEVTVDLSALENKEVDESTYKERKNDFLFDLPHTDNTVTIKILTHKDELLIEREIQGNKKINKNSSTLTTSRLKYMITSVNGSRENKDIREFVDNFLLAKDARAIREFYTSISPDVNMVYYKDGREEAADIPIGIGFFWPDAAV
jgi:hypothetical protein